MAGHGGKREGAGRKSKKEEQKANFMFLTALKRIHSTEEDEEAKIKFIEDLYESQRGQIFIAEHLFGKPTERVESINHNLNREPTKEEAEAIAKALMEKY